MQFTKAIRKQARLRLALTGPSGSGKTYSALLLAKGLGGKVAVIDTERGSASLYSDLLEFDTLELNPPYSPERFIEAMKAAQGAGYEVLIIDSITHEWSGTGGCLELNEQLARSRYKGNTWSAWNEVTPRHRAFLDAINQSPLHIIATMRSKTETAQTDNGGKKTVTKLGMKAEQRDGTEYEFTVVLDLVHDGHFATASKDRSGLFVDRDPQPITITTGQVLMQWLNSGAPMTEPAPEPEVKQDVHAESKFLDSDPDEFLSEDQKNDLQKYAERMNAALAKGNTAKVIELQETLRTLSAEEQRHGWLLLGSKERRAITEILAAAKKAKADEAKEFVQAAQGAILNAAHDPHTTKEAA